jgi:MFS family permease
MITSPTARPRFFYGWVIVFIAIVAGAFGPGVSVWSAGVFLTPMTEEFGWSRAEFGLGLALRSLTSAAVAPWIGPVFDKPNGPRRLMMVSVAALGLSMVAMRFIGDGLGFGVVSPRIQYYLLFGVVGGAAQMGSGMGLGQTILPKWFIKRRGRVMGIASTGTAMAPLLFPPIVQSLTDVLGFRAAWGVIGIAMLGIVFPLSFLVRTQPEDIGLLPDNEPPGDRQAAAAAAIDDAATYTRRDAVRTQSFWFLTASFALISLGMVGYQANWQPYFVDVGFAPKVAAFAISFYAIFSISSRLIWGTLGDRYHPRTLIIIGLLMVCGSAIFLQVVNTLPELLFFGVIQGLSIGSWVILQPLLVSRYFGRRHLGAIFGLMRPVMTLFGSASPLMIGALYDVRGSYTLAFAVVALSWFLAAVLVMFVREPRRAAALRPSSSG